MKNKFILFIVLAFLFTSYSFADTDISKASSPEELINSGDSLLNQDKNSEALEAYKKAVGISPNLVDAHLGLGRAYARTKEYDKAIEQMEFVIKLDPQRRKNMLPNLILLYLYKNDIKSVQRFWELKHVDRQLAESFFPEIFNARIYGIKEINGGLLVAHYFVDGSTKRTLEVAKNAEFFITGGDYAQAVSLYKEFLSKDDLTSKEKALINDTIGNLYCKYLKDPQNALLFLKQAVALDTEELAYRISLIDVYRMLQQYDNALDEVNKILASDAKSKYGLYMQGVIYFKKADWTNAFKSWDKLKQVDNILFGLIEESYNKAKDYSSALAPAISQNQIIKTKKWVNSKGDMEIWYPEGWYVKEIYQPNIKQIFFSLENIDHTKWYSTGIGITIFNGHPNGPNFDANRFFDSRTDFEKKNGDFISEERKNIETDYGYKVVMSKRSFVNKKGEKETTWEAVYVKSDSEALIICESPIKDASKYDEFFIKTIKSVKLL